MPVRPKPFAVLAYLTTHPGGLVAAAELRQAVWPTPMWVRACCGATSVRCGSDLEMTPDSDRFIEPLPCRRYRFLAKGVSSQQSVVSGTTVVSGQSSVISPPLTLPLRSPLATGESSGEP